MQHNTVELSHRQSASARNGIISLSHAGSGESVPMGPDLTTSHSYIRVPDLFSVVQLRQTVFSTTLQSLDIVGNESTMVACGMTYHGLNHSLILLSSDT